ncbi:sensor histidine kinase [Streptomyces sp. NPDC004609]|uniref:sensor histidine kinase n=1 Tax=Streptomyces sp. NPDC004609 TaxID=3364704 RepID=UPI00368CF655
MSALPSPPLLKRVSPSVWTALAWAVGLVFTFLMRFELPGEASPTVAPGVLIFRWDGLLALALATAMTLGGCVLLVRRPLAAIALLLAGAALGTTPVGAMEIPPAQFLAVDVGLCAIAATSSRRTGIVALALALTVPTGFITVRLLSGWSVGTSVTLIVSLATGIAWLIGRSTYQAREYAEKLGAQAAAQAVTAERLRIARELHDMVAHSIGIIALQAGAASRVIDTQPARAREALSTIELTGRESLSGLRRVLGALRTPEPGQTTDAAATPGPRPEAGSDTGLGLGLADVERLAAATTAAGVRVDVEWRGERRPLPPDIDMSAYRIVQEAVTNVVRHAGTPSCRVVLDRRDEELSIEVLDGGRGLDGGQGNDGGRGDEGGRGNGRVPWHGCGRGHDRGPRHDGRRGHDGGAGGGYGLIGMRERVGLLHGEFSARPRPEGGFRVAARLPVPAGVR